MIAPLVALAFLALPLVAQAPQGWDDTHLRGLELVSEGKSEEAIALYEGAVARAPDFDGALYALADAHRMLALQLAAQGPSEDASRRRHLEVRGDALSSGCGGRLGVPRARRPAIDGRLR